MRTIPIVQVDAFADRPFTGNPAAVVVLDTPRPDAWLAAVADEMNLAETAFVRARDDGEWELRWFTPTVEVDLCGHATLAAAHHLWETGRAAANEAIRFHTRSGVLGAERHDGMIELDFPATPVEPAPPPPTLAAALGATPVATGRSRFDLVAELASADAVRTLTPDLGAVARLAARGVIVTAAADGDAGVDFVSRFFAPQSGVPEDPVTGSAHCALAPYWGARLGRDAMTGYQASRRGGRVRVRLVGERVRLGGRAITMLDGELRDDA